MANRWLLIETFGGEGHEEPTVIGIGRTPKRMVPIASVLGRGRYLDDVRALVARVADSGRPVRAKSLDGRRQLIGDPLICFSGQVHGVYAWTGDPGEQPPPRDLAGAWYFNLTTDKIGGSDDLLDLYGVAPEDRRQERLTAEAFGRLLPNADEASALALLVKAQPGTEHQATWTVRRDDGELRAVNLACRVVAETYMDGSREVVLRGITHDLGPADSTPSAPRSMVLAQQVIAAERAKGKHRAIMNLRTLTLVRWIDDPMPGIAWENDAPFRPAIHPEDLALARRMSDQLKTAEQSEGRLRVRSVSGGWIPVAVTARLMLLDRQTTAALVTVSACAEPSG